MEHGTVALQDHQSLATLPPIVAPPGSGFHIVDNIGYPDQLSMSQLLDSELGVAFQEWAEGTIFPQLFENPATRGSVELNGPALALFIGDIVEGTNRDARDAAYIPQPPNSFDAVLIARCQAEATRAISSYDPRPPLPAAAAVTGR
jgi:hypothetical protein